MIDGKILAVGVLSGFTLFGTAATSYGLTLKTYQFTINSVNLMSYVLTDGADGTSAAANGVYNGARLYRGNDSRSYVTSQHNEFVNWATTTTDRLACFNLWGYFGQGTSWGETYKVYDWPSTPTSSDSNWSGFLVDWPWGSFDDYADGITGYGDHYNDGQLLSWSTTTYANALPLGSTGTTFTFLMTLNMDDPAFYGDSSPWYNGEEGKLVFWFGGGIYDQYNRDKGLYEGNIILQGTPIPEPGTMLLLGTGLSGLIASRIRRKKKSAR